MSILRRIYSAYDYLIQNKTMLHNRRWLEEFLRPHCKIKRMGWRGTRLRILQFPYEFAGFLQFMSSYQVKTYLEVGVSTGGSFLMADSYLRAAVPGFVRSVGYDRTAKLRDWIEYKAKFPATEFRHQSSRDMYLQDERFDMAFIDARHIEKWVLQDFEKVKNNCRFVAFHDIVLEGSTVGLAWAKIKSQYPEHWEFIDLEAPANARCGIGVVKIN